MRTTRKAPLFPRSLNPENEFLRTQSTSSNHPVSSQPCALTDLQEAGPQAGGGGPRSVWTKAAMPVSEITATEMSPLTLRLTAGSLASGVQALAWGRSWPSPVSASWLLFNPCFQLATSCLPSASLRWNAQPFPQVGEASYLLHKRQGT